jgi:hypothetical protein
VLGDDLLFIYDERVSGSNIYVNTCRPEHTMMNGHVSDGNEWFLLSHQDTHSTI